MRSYKVPDLSFFLSAVVTGKFSQEMSWQLCLGGGCLIAGRKVNQEMLM